MASTVRSVLARRTLPETDDVHFTANQWRAGIDIVRVGLGPRVDPYALHNEATMEGFFTHIHSPSSTGHPYTLVIIFCEVKHAIDPNSRVMVYVLYAPGHVPPRESGASLQDPHGFTCELLSSGWKIIGNDATPVKDDLQEWKVQVEGVGTMEIGRHTQLWTVHIPAHQSAGHGDLELVVETTKRTPWTTESIIAGPEGPFERFGPLLPLSVVSIGDARWQLRKGYSPAKFPESSLESSRPSAEVLASGTAAAHIEKNHGVGFPTAWIWAHSISPSASSRASLYDPNVAPYQQYPVRFAVAGGRIIGIEAYLVGFRDDERGIAWDFTPPFTVGLAGRGIGMKTSRNWEKRVVSLDVWDWGRWLHVEMTAPADTFVPMSGPLSKGFAPDLCHESFQARFRITCYERPMRFSWSRPWSLVSGSEWQWRETAAYDIEEAALEFGGDYVGEEARGTKVHGE